jgi:transposase
MPRKTNKTRKKKQQPGRRVESIAANNKPVAPAIDYDKLRRSAYEYIVVQGWHQNAVAELLGVSEQSLSHWSQQGKWQEERRSRMMCYKTDTDNSKRLLKLVTEKRLDVELKALEAERKGEADVEIALRKEARGLSDEISKLTKSMEKLDKDNRVTLGVYIDVMDDIFKALHLHDEDIFNKTVDFQSLHIRRKSIELG